MDRVFVILLLAAAALSVTVSAHDDDPWFPPGWGWDDSPPPPTDSAPPPADGSPPPLYPSPTTPDNPPSPYYDSPPPSEAPYAEKQVSAEELFEDEDSVADDIDASFYGSPSYSSPLGAPLYDSAPSYHEIAWMTDRLVENPDSWPAPYTSTTTVQEAFGSDAEKVYGSVSLLDGLSSKGDDGFSKLLKEAITALLNAIDEHFKISEDEIKDCFSMHKSLASEQAAADQANTFAQANAEYAANHS